MITQSHWLPDLRLTLPTHWNCMIRSCLRQSPPPPLSLCSHVSVEALQWTDLSILRVFVSTQILTLPTRGGQGLGCCSKNRKKKIIPWVVSIVIWLVSLHTVEENIKSLLNTLLHKQTFISCTSRTNYRYECECYSTFSKLSRHTLQ